MEAQTEQPDDDIFSSSSSDDQQTPNDDPEERYLPVKPGDVYNERYTVIRKLGRGTFSTVWQCTDHQDPRPKALKIARCGPTITEVTMDEIELLECVRTKSAQIPGPHQTKIVQLLENFTISGPDDTTHVCLVFELLGANLQTLAAKWAPSGFPLAIVKSIMRQVLEGLDFLHTECRIIHTDIKPANICIGANEARKLAQWRVGSVDELSVKIADLGSACWVDHHFYDLIQTCSYRCPEVLLGGDYGTLADIWSAACTGFELATGSLLFRPHDGDDLAEDEKHLARIVHLFGDLPVEMVRGLKRWEEVFTEEGKLVNYGNFEAWGIGEMLARRYCWNVDEARRFGEFLTPMFAVDPNERCSARDALQHPWLKC